jgi:hypothetical protein
MIINPTKLVTFRQALLLPLGVALDEFIVVDWPRKQRRQNKWLRRLRENARKVHGR